MSSLDVILLIAALLGWLTSARWYLELWRWSKQYQLARIIIYYKNRYQFAEPLSQWLQWYKTKDSKSQARIVWSRAGVSVGVGQPASMNLTGAALVRELLARRRARKSTPHERKTGRFAIEKERTK